MCVSVTVKRTKYLCRIESINLSDSVKGNFIWKHLDCRCEICEYWIKSSYILSYNSIEVDDLLDVVVFVATAAAVPPPPPPSTEATPAPVLPGNLKNDGSFLEQFKKMQQQENILGHILHAQYVHWFTIVLEVS